MWYMSLTSSSEVVFVCMFILILFSFKLLDVQKICQLFPLSNLTFVIWQCLGSSTGSPDTLFGATPVSNILPEVSFTENSNFKENGYTY